MITMALTMSSLDKQQLQNATRSTAEVITPLQIYSIPTVACAWSNRKICRTFILSQISTYLEWAKNITYTESDF